MRLEPVSSHHKGQYRLVNDQGISDEASLVLVVDGAMGSWTEFGACSKTCTQTNGTSGEEKGGSCNIFYFREPGADKAVCPTRERWSSMYWGIGGQQAVWHPSMSRCPVFDNKYFSLFILVRQTCPFVPLNFEI